MKAKHQSVGDVRGLGVFWAIELVKNRETREPYVPFNASGPDAKPMMDLIVACKERNLWPFTHFNRIHVVPPCNTPVEDVQKVLRSSMKFSISPTNTAKTDLAQPASKYAHRLASS